MRPIKFRGLSINEDWFYGLLSISQGKQGQPPKGSYISNSAGQPWAYQVRPETVCQYIGKPDKNKKEIYEGDFLKHPDFGIKYVTDIRDVNTANSACYDCFAYSGDMAVSEIIGNQFENIELLKYKI